MLKELINQFFIFISFIFIGAHIIRDNELLNLKTLTKHILIGLYGGLMAITLMSFTIPFSGTSTVVDLRFMAILLIYFYFGFTPGVVTAIITIIYRLTLGGVNESSITAIIGICLLVGSYWIIDQIVSDYIKKWILFFSVSIIISLLSLYYLLNDTDYVISVLSNYLLVSVGGTLILYALSEYAKTSNELYRKYKIISSKDFLTGLNNTRQFDVLYNDLINRAKVLNYSIGMMMIDIDHFKRVNDTYGHQAGDAVLKQVSVILTNAVCKNCSVSRIGGEEFSILIEHMAIDDVTKLAEEVRHTVETHEFLFEQISTMKVTVSIGVAISPDTISSPEELKERADALLYQAKQTGRNKVCL